MIFHQFLRAFFEVHSPRHIHCLVSIILYSFQNAQAHVLGTRAVDAIASIGRLLISLVEGLFSCMGPCLHIHGGNCTVRSSAFVLFDVLSCVSFVFLLLTLFFPRISTRNGDADLFLKFSFAKLGMR
jgi:hypothetical protein